MTEPKPKPDAKPTTYVILERQSVTATIVDGSDRDPTEAWTVAGQTEARSKDEACKLHAGDELAGSWKAIPLSSWSGGLITFSQTSMASKPLEEKE